MNVFLPLFLVFAFGALWLLDRFDAPRWARSAWRVALMLFAAAYLVALAMGQRIAINVPEPYASLIWLAGLGAVFVIGIRMARGGRGSDPTQANTQ